ncbi:AUGMIN subunit 5 isoform X1 [Elaeis guineensis]|uniref:AUGMIN subunit 5 isoform X1 n=1 Tax=Elaeis guineensis var. tenera TaxID=51953 RepID=A0A6I9RUL5_ELAGV|nr:AUGMIN subunit 5 isoform X1 [Elaeis guineensis]
MQGPGGSTPRPEAILEWLQKEMGYPSPPPSADQLRKICRGNMVPVWSFLLQRVRSERTVATARRNIMVHGVPPAVDGGRGRRREREKGKFEEGSSLESRETALRERDLAEEEAERLRNVVRRQRKELRARMVEVAREESERKRMLDERSNARHKQVMLEAYDQQCDEATKIFAEYQRRLHHYVNQARDVRRLTTGSAVDAVDDPHAHGEKEAVYSTVKGNRSSDDIILIETSRERNIRKACETLAAHMIERIRSTFPAYEGSGISLNAQLDAAKLGLDLDGEVPEDIKTVALDALKNPYLLLQSITTYTSRVNMLIHRETEKIDIRADAELLRYKYENDRVTDAASPDASSPLPYQVYGNGKIGTDLSTKGTYNQLLERQKAHVQQFVATEDALNKAAEAKALCQKLLKRLHGSNDTVSSQILPAGGTSQNLGNIRHLELEVWTRERDVAGLRASLSTLTSEVQRLNKLCTEWKEAEDSLKKKWKKIEEFDARRSEVESIYTALLRANMDASAFWDQQPLAAREHAARTIIPACTAVVNISNSAKDLIEKEVSAFYQSLDNSLYMMPATAQGLLEFMGANGATGPDALSAAEKHAAILTARAGAGDPSAIPSICRIIAALQYHPGAESSDAGLASVLESLEFCLKLRGSEASVLEDLSRAINLVHTRRNLVENNRVLLNHAHRVQQEYERMANYCLKLSGEQEKVVTERWLPELRNAVLDAQRCLTDCQRVRGLVDEWWEQPAATAVDWVTVDGQTVGAWLNLVKQLQMAFYDKELL